MQEPEEVDLNPEENGQGEIHTVNLWIRLGNYFIDQFFISGLYNLITIVALKFGIFLKLPLDIDKNFNFKVDNLSVEVNLSLIFLYYLIMESTRGQTIGKMITRTIVVNRYDEPPSWGEIALRTLCRMIPLEALSFLPNGIGWHDRLSHTYVKPIDPQVTNF